MTKSYLTPHKHSISKEDRNLFLGNKSLVLWFTGLSGSGKSTLAGNLEEKLFTKKILTFILDGDNIRLGLNKDLRFSLEDRKENIRRIGEVSKLMTDSGIVVLSAFISPLREDRDTVRKVLGKNNFLEIYVRCPLNVCEERDVKGLYSKARAGEINNFTGISSPYEEPLNPDIIIDTYGTTIQEATEILYNFVEPKLRL